MDANSIRYRPRQSGDARIAVIPSAARYLDQMERCHQLAYGYTPGGGDDEDMTAEKYARHLDIFPEGQFIALDVLTDMVIGVTTSMRVKLPSDRHFLGSWAQVTGGG